MRFLNDALLLQVWETGQFVSPIGRSLVILGAVYPEYSQEKTARLPLGQRDAYLMQARRLRFGPLFKARGDCPQCSEKLELTLNSDEIMGLTSLPEVIRETPTASVCVDDYEITFRTPNTLDLLAVADCRDVVIAQRTLFERCILAASKGGQMIVVTELSDDWMPIIAGEVSKHDPLAEILVRMECPACGHVWQAQLDVATYFWAEISADAARLLRNVHTLAAVYHWSETDILAMSPIRREGYLRLVHHE